MGGVTNAAPSGSGRPFALRSLQCLMAIGLGWGSAVAQTSAIHAPVPPQCEQPLPPDAPSAQEHFTTLEPLCLRSPGYYRHYGQWLLQQHNPASAIEALERSLLLDPDHLGTQLDYAQALLAAGDTDSAFNILGALRAMPDLPAHLAALMDFQLLLVQRQNAPAATIPANGFYSKVMLSQAVGGDSNLNNATTTTNVTLTYPDLDVNLPLAPAFLPQSGGTATTALQWTGLLPQDRHAWLFQVEGRTRHTASHATRYQQLEAQATWLQDPVAPTQWIVRAEHTQLHWGGRKLYSSQRLGTQHQWLHARADSSCRTAAGIEVEGRAFPGTSTLNGNYHGGLLTLVCQKQDSINIQLRAGIDQPRNAERPGGTQQQSELRVQWQTRQGAYNLQTEYAVQHQQDAEGYSPLLLRNAQRRILRHSWRLEASRPLDWPAFGSPHWFGSVEYTQQRSNLQAFHSSRSAAQTGLRWTWP